MKSYTVLVIIITCVMLYSFYINAVTLFFVSFLTIPIIIIFKLIKKNGIPFIHNKTKLGFNVSDVKKTRSDIINELLLGISFFRRLNNYFKNGYSNDIEPSGLSRSAKDVSIKNLKMVIGSGVILTIISIMMFVVTGSYFSFSVVIISPIIFFLNRYELKTPINQRKKGVEKEIWVFSVFCDIMDNTQSGIYKVFESLVNDESELFPYMKKEGLILKRDVVAFSNSSFEALKNMANTHPSEIFSQFINGYLTSQSVGGRDTGDYITEKTREYHNLIKQKMKSYVEISDTISQMVIFLLIMYPIIVVASSTMTTGENLLIMVGFGFVFMPILIFILIKKIESISPFENDVVPFRKIPVIISIIIFVVCVVIDLKSWEIIIIPFFVWSFSNYIMIKKVLTTNTNIDKSIPQFVRDMNQTMLSGSSFFESFNSINDKKSYTLEFNKIIGQITKEVKFGEGLSNSMVSVNTTSWLSKLMIRLISFTSKSGEITPQIMEKLAKFSNDYIESKNDVESKTMMSVILAYFGSIVGLALILLIPSIGMGDMAEVIDGVNDISMNDTLTSLSISLVVMTSFLSMVLVSKVRYGTIKHSLNGAVLMIIIMGILYYDKFIGITI